jgi:sortase A
MAFGLYEVLGGKLYQAWRGRQLDEMLERVPPARPSPPRGLVYPPGSAIGRFEISRIGFSVVVLEGSTASTLRLGVARLRNSSLPWQTGNVILAGHRDTFFRSLQDVRPGDEIALRTTQGTFPYKVDWTRVVNPEDTSVLMSTSKPTLTLVTCYTFYYVGSAPKRFIVRAVAADAAGTASASR